MKEETRKSPRSPYGLPTPFAKGGDRVKRGRGISLPLRTWLEGSLWWTFSIHAWWTFWLECFLRCAVIHRAPLGDVVEIANRKLGTIGDIILATLWTLKDEFLSRLLRSDHLVAITTVKSQGHWLDVLFVFGDGDDLAGFSIHAGILSDIETHATIILCARITMWTSGLCWLI